LLAGAPTPIDYRPSFVDGIGGKGVLAEMWPLARRLLDASLVVPLEAVAEAIRLLAERNHVVAEGAGAAPAAAALAGRAGRGRGGGMRGMGPPEAAGLDRRGRGKLNRVRVSCSRRFDLADGRVVDSQAERRSRRGRRGASEP